MRHHTHDMYMALGITQQANYAQSRSVKLIVLIGPLCLFPRRATFYSKRFPPSEGQEAAVCFYPPSKCLSFSADGADLESPRGKKKQQKKPKNLKGERGFGVRQTGKSTLRFFWCDIMLLFFAWRFGNILELLITAQIICIVSNGPL